MQPTAAKGKALSCAGPARLPPGDHGSEQPHRLPLLRRPAVPDFAALLGNALRATDHMARPGRPAPIAGEEIATLVDCVLELQLLDRGDEHSGLEPGLE